MAPRMTHQYCVSVWLAPITMRVGSGSWRFTDANMFWKVGMTKISSTEIAMIYPGVILSVAVIAISVLLIFVLPTFQNMFASVHLQLPLPTPIVTGASHTPPQDASGT